jgi:Domain of unknown function (DUF4303)
MEFDINKFRKILLEECKNTIPKIISDLSSEKIYSIALYTSGDEWVYLFPSVSTFFGLSKAVEKYEKNSSFSHLTKKELEMELKWSPCDSPRHDTYFSSFPETQKIVESLANIMQELYDEEHDDWQKSDDLHKALVSTCIDVLNELDNLGFFSNNIDRNSVTINLLNGDQSTQERFERAKRLNPEVVYQNYFNEN